MGAKISHLRTHQVQSSSEWECLSCWPWGRVGGGSFVILLFTCGKGFVVTWELTWCSHYTLFSLGPASSCHDHWHGHSCFAPLAHGAQSARRARALFPSVPCLLWITGASPVHSAEDPWPGHRAPNRKRNWDPEHCVMVTNSALREGGMSSWRRILMAAATGDPTGPGSPTGGCELRARAGMMSVTVVTPGWGEGVLDSELATIMLWPGSGPAPSSELGPGSLHGLGSFSRRSELGLSSPESDWLRLN